MEHRALGNSGFKVPVLTLGVATLGGGAEFFRTPGAAKIATVRRMVDVCLEAGVTMFDCADIYSDGLVEEILGKAVAGRRDRAILSTKAMFRHGPGSNDIGSSRHHLIRAVDAALRRFGTDYIDLFQLHGFDAQTRIEETLDTLDGLVTSGKLRYLGCSNFSGWHVMKTLGIAERCGYPRYVAQQVYYSLVGREYEWELMPLGVDQAVSALVWSPLGRGRLTGNIRRGQVHAAKSTGGKGGPPVADELLFRVTDALDVLARETGKTVPQVALNWLLQRPTVASIIIGARNEEQLRDNLGAVGWALTPSQIAALDHASEVTPVYPYWHQHRFAERNPPPIPTAG